MRTAYGLDLFGLLLVGGFVGSFVGLIAGAGIYAAFVRLGRGR